MKTTYKSITLTVAGTRLFPQFMEDENIQIHNNGVDGTACRHRSGFLLL